MRCLQRSLVKIGADRPLGVRRLALRRTLNTLVTMPFNGRQDRRTLEIEVGHFKRCVGRIKLRLRHVGGLLGLLDLLPRDGNIGQTLTAYKIAFGLIERRLLARHIGFGLIERSYARGA